MRKYLKKNLLVNLMKWLFALCSFIILIVLQWSSLLWRSKQSFWFLSVVATVVLISFIIYPFFTGRISARKIGRVGVISLVFTILCFSSSHLMNSWRGVGQFNYRYGNGAGAFQVFTQNAVAQKMIGFLINQLPVSGGYIILTAEDASRVWGVKEYLSGDSYSYCRDQTGYKCFMDVYDVIEARAPLTITGIVLMTAVGAFKIHESKKYITKSEDQLLGLKLVDMMVRQCRDSATRSRIDQVMNDFPLSDVNKLSSDDKKKLLEKIEEAERKNSDLLYVKNIASTIGTGAGEAFLLLETENTIRKKWGNVLASKGMGLLVAATVYLYTDYFPHKANSIEKVALQRELTNLYTGIRSCQSLISRSIL